jgi:IS30 family transposase
MAMTVQGNSVREIAVVLERAPSTIGRELRRNGYHSPAERGSMGRPTICGGYDAARAGRRALYWRRRSRRARKLDFAGALWKRVHEHLMIGWSPQQIAGRLGGVSHQTIYTAIYAIPRGALRREFTVLLRQHRAEQRPRSRGTEKRGKMKDLLSIHLRPPEANDRLLPGHWEGDLLIGSRNRSAVGTLVDRRSLFVMLAKMENNSALAALEGFSTAFGPLPQDLRKTLTYDQGKEMALHAQLAERTGLTIYFADPHSPWQRGINENTNGLLRQYLPKNADLSLHSQRELDQIAWRLNTRPRKSLGYRTPAEVFFSYYSIPTVALEA